MSPVHPGHGRRSGRQRPDGGHLRGFVRRRNPGPFCKPLEVAANRFQENLVAILRIGSTLSASGGAQTDGSATLQAQVALFVRRRRRGRIGRHSKPISRCRRRVSVSSGSAGPTATVSISAAGWRRPPARPGRGRGLLAGAGAASAAGNATLAAQLDAYASAPPRPVDRRRYPADRPARFRRPAGPPPRGRPC